MLLYFIYFFNILYYKICHNKSFKIFILPSIYKINIDFFFKFIFYNLINFVYILLFYTYYFRYLLKLMYIYYPTFYLVCVKKIGFWYVFFLKLHFKTKININNYYQIFTSTSLNKNIFLYNYVLYDVFYSIYYIIFFIHNIYLIYYYNYYIWWRTDFIRFSYKIHINRVNGVYTIKYNWYYYKNKYILKKEKIINDIKNKILNKMKNVKMYIIYYYYKCKRFFINSFNKILYFISVFIYYIQYLYYHYLINLLFYPIIKYKGHLIIYYIFLVLKYIKSIVIYLFNRYLKWKK
jgi:hypothetical protein